VLDGQGRVRPDDRTRISLDIVGPADLIGFGSANPHAVGSFQSRLAETFHGKALVILRGQGVGGLVRVTARSEGLATASATIRLT
jgi:beta-galactosidase